MLRRWVIAWYLILTALHALNTSRLHAADIGYSDVAWGEAVSSFLGLDLSRDVSLNPDRKS